MLSMAGNEKEMTITEKNTRVSASNLSDIKGKYVKTGVFKKWINERTFLPLDANLIQREVEGHTTEIGKEKRARKMIVSAVKRDISASEWGYPICHLNIGGPPGASMDYGIFGNPDTQARKVMEDVEILLAEGGLDVSIQKSISITGGIREVPMGSIKVVKHDSITNEEVEIIVGRDGNDFFAQEIGYGGRLISEARINRQGDYSYRLILNFNGQRYQDCGGEININSTSLPRATVTTFGLLVGVVRNSQKEIIEV